MLANDFVKSISKRKKKKELPTRVLTKSGKQEKGENSRSTENREI